jgi:DNA-binding winged helix-turn-helix (wHTH) protein
MQICFGDFVVNTDTRELLRGTEPIHLSPKAFRLLEILLEIRPRAAAKAILQERLWPDTFVVEANLSNLVGEVRAALDDNPRRPRFIRTVHRFGYAFHESQPDKRHPKVESPGTLCRLVWKTGRKTLAEGEHVLGRDPALELCLDAPSVSRRHARLRIRRGEAVLEDLGSKNGTFVNGQKVSGRVRLSDRDKICVGSVRLTFRSLLPPPSTETTY